METIGGERGDGLAGDREPKGSSGRRRSGGSRKVGTDEVRRKGPLSVIAIVPPPISQSRLRSAGQLQAIAWQAHLAAHESLAAIKRDISRGAMVEPGEMEYNAELGMVRTRKVKVG